VLKFVPELIENGRVQHSWMGISGSTITAPIAEAYQLDASQRGVLVMTVTGGGPAEQAGLRGGSQPGSFNGQQIALGGDVILSVDGLAVESFEDLISYLYNQTDPGQTITLGILRGGEQQTIELTLGARPV
jgi:2-alkenal reductase